MSAPASTIQELMYKNVKTVLHATSALTAIVPTANIFPNNDPGLERQGHLVVYEIQAFRWHEKFQRADFQFVVNAESLTNKVHAEQIMNLVRAAITARTLTISPLRLALFREQEGPSDAVLSPQNRHVCSQTFAVKAILDRVS